MWISKSGKIKLLDVKAVVTLEQRWNSDSERDVRELLETDINKFFVLGGGCMGPCFEIIYLYIYVCFFKIFIGV